MIRLIVITVVCGGLTWLFATNLVRAPRKGVIWYSGSVVAKRRTQPVRFWSMVLFNIVFLLVCVSLIVMLSPMLWSSK